jgi:hypothetical protein
MTTTTNGPLDDRAVADIDIETTTSERWPNACGKAPVTCVLVRLKGTMTPNGYRPENFEHLEALTEVVPGKWTRRVGRDPLTLSVEVLTAAGHGPRRTRDIIAAMGGEEVIDPTIREYSDLRRHCLSCKENAAEVRRCAIINCPMWPYRMGRNPHNPQRGINPFDGPTSQAREATTR